MQTDKSEHEKERDDMQRARDRQNWRVAEAVIKKIAGKLPQHHAAHRAAQPDQPGNRADGASWKDHETVAGGKFCETL